MKVSGRLAADSGLLTVLRRWKLSGAIALVVGTVLLFLVGVLIVLLLRNVLSRVMAAGGTSLLVCVLRSASVVVV